MVLKFPQSLVENTTIQELDNIYMKDLIKNSSMLIREQKNKGTAQTQSFKISKSKPILTRYTKFLPHITVSPRKN